jgi:TPR repeat protein
MRSVFQLFALFLSLSVTNHGVYATPSDARYQVFEAEMASAREAIRIRNYLKAMALLPPLAGKGNYLAQQELAEMYYFGYGVKIDKQKADEWCRKASSDIMRVAESGNEEMQMAASRFYLLGCGKNEDNDEAGRWKDRALSKFTERAERGDIKAMKVIANQSRDENEKRLYWLTRAAEGGDARAAFELGISYEPGYGSHGDKAKADYWSKEAFKRSLAVAKKGDAEAQDSVGYFYRYGTGTEFDPNEAASWWAKAAAHGNRSAQSQLGRLYLAAKMPAKALGYLKRAARQGDELAFYELAQMYKSGNGVKMDTAEYKKWLRQAADQGHMRAESELQELQLNP